MARYKPIDTSPRFLAVDLERQLLPGSFEHALNHLIDHELDLTGFDSRYKNDLTGAAAYPPAMLLKVVLFAFRVQPRHRQQPGDRTRLPRTHHLHRPLRRQFSALDRRKSPFRDTTLAAFVSGLGEDIAKLFAQVL
jgi:hypothetical protein